MSFEQLRYLIPGIRDLVEILIVAYVIYRLLLYMAGTRALQILVGLVVLGIVYVGANLLQFNMITSLLGFVFAYWAFGARRVPARVAERPGASRAGPVLQRIGPNVGSCRGR